MPTKTGTAAFMDKYNELSVADQTVLQAVSALWEPASANLAASCLAAAGFRESPLRAFSPQIVATRLARLAKAGFLAESAAANARGQKVRLWQCRPEIGEIALRHAVRDGKFLPVAKAALTETRGRDWKAEGAEDSPGRRLRLAFHAGDWRLAGNEIAGLGENAPGEGGAMLAQLIRLQPDDSWKRSAKPVLFGPVLAAAMKDLLAGWRDGAALEDAARECLDRDRENPGRTALLFTLLDSLTLRGKMKEARKLASEVEGALRPAAELPPAVAEGAAEAPELAETALARRRAKLGARDALPGDSGAVWQALAVLSSGAGESAEAVEAMARRLTAPFLRQHEYGGALDCLRHAFLLMTGEASAARLLPASPPDGHPFTVLCHGLALLRIHPSPAADAAEKYRARAQTAQAAGYRWLAAQLSAIADAAAGVETGGEKAGGGNAESRAARDAGKWPALTRFFRGDDAWRRGLRALDDLASGDGAGDSLPQKRLAWLVQFPANPESPFVPFDVQPVEQTQTRDGGWSKGRNVALRRIFHRAADLTCALDQDRMVFSALRYDYEGQVNGFRFDAGQALTFLVGHPHVYRGDAGGAKVDIVPGRFELSVAEKDGGCEIAMEPALEDFLPRRGAAGADAAPFTDAGTGERIYTPIGDIDAPHVESEEEAEEARRQRGGAAAAEFPAPGEDLPGTAARMETPTRLRVYSLGERERRLARIVGDGLVVPAHGRDEAIRTLTRLSGKIHMHSDIPGLAGEGEAVTADDRPRFHIMPQNPGLKVEVWAHPLGDDGPAYRPGKGGKVLTAEVDGRTVRTTRDVAREKDLAAAAVAACPALEGKMDGDLSWRLENPEDALAFLAETEDLGGKAVLAWPKGGRFRVRRLRGLGGVSIRVNSSSEWFELDGAVRIDENLVADMASLLASLRESGGKFVEIGEGEFVALTEELRRQLLDLEAMGEFHNGKFRLPVLAGGLLEELAGSGAELVEDAEWRRGLERRRELAGFTPELPEGFNAELRDYQLEGYRWMARLAEWGAGACLADDMGLGKTVQALAILARRAHAGPALVVAPTSVCHNWISETIRFAPHLRMRQFGEGDRAARIAALGPGDVLMTSYSLLRQEDKLLGGVHWSTVVLDEAQAIKNIAAKRSKAAMALDADFRLITTGTPIENHLSELWNLFRFINPHLLGSWRKFQDRFGVPIERNRDHEAALRLRRIIRPFILRRTKAQVLGSLPPKTEITLAVELGERERAFYESLRRGAVERLDAEAAEGGSAEKRRFLILAEIMRLRRACCSPELAGGGADFPSAKQEQFKETLSELVANNHKVLVFSQFVDHLSIIRRHLDAMGIRYQYLDGSTPAKARKKAVDDFQGGVGDVFLISLKAGGLGLNLTAADYVIHMDPWWNPAVEDQASDRAHRIGQEKPVTVYRLVAAGTIEEKIVELHRDKRDLADNLLSGADRAAGLDMEEILRLLRDY